jgi:hypothetical protein
VLLVLLGLHLTVAQVSRAAWDRGTGRAVAGTDLARMLPPAGAVVESYENHGYRLRNLDGEVWVEVDASAVGSTVRWQAPKGWPNDALGRLGRSITAGAGSEYEVSSRILGWVASHVSYELDRDQSQAPTEVLERRTAYCTGFARVAVSLLQAAGLEAREVAGYVLGDGTSEFQGFHRWIETRFSDVGWVFSDPLLSHHYVPATYVRLGSETVIPEDGLDGLLIERREGVVAVDISPHAPPGVRIRRNDNRQLAGALRVEVPGAGGGLAVLEGNAERLTNTLVSDATTFLGLEPGNYLLEVRVAGLPPMRREFDLSDRGRTLLTLDLSTAETAWHSPGHAASDRVDETRAATTSSYPTARPMEPVDR